MSVTDDIKSRIDIVSYVQRHVPALKKAGRNHKACCPFHNEKTPSFVVNPARQSWHCFGACAEGGDLFTFAQKLHGWDFKQALHELANEAGVQLRPQSAQQKRHSDRLDQLLGLLASAAEFYQRQLQREAAAGVRHYLSESRGLIAATVQAFQLGYAPESWDFMLRSLRELGHSDADIVEVGLAVRNENGRVYDRFRNRLMIPIRDERGRVIGFGGRALDPNENAKYINSPQSALFDKSRLLYGLDAGKAAIRESGTAVIVEGYMDVIQAHQAGYANVVAQMGTALTEPQIELAALRGAKRLIVACDTDEAGQIATLRSSERASSSDVNVPRSSATLPAVYFRQLAVDMRVLKLPFGKDLDEYLRESPAGLSDLIDSAPDLAEFLIDAKAAALPSNPSVKERQAVAEEVLSFLLLSENNIYREENIQKLARRLRFSERDMLSWSRERLALVAKELRRSRTEPPPPEAPPEYWDNEYAAAAPDAVVGGDGAPNAAESTAAAQAANRALEAYCLSVLLKHPKLLYQINRKLRELAGDDRALLQGPLSELCPEDFTQSQYRALMEHLQASMAQHTEETLAYLERAVDADLLTEYRSLLLEKPDWVSRRMRGNFRVDLNDIFRRGSARGRPGLNPQDELICRALQLRLERLESERVELQYLQEEAQEGRENDEEQRALVSEKIMLSMRAKARINVAVS